MDGIGRITGLATAAPPIEASANEVWEALGQIRGRRMPKLSTEEGARMRRLAEPLSSLMTARGQSQQTENSGQGGRRRRPDRIGQQAEIKKPERADSNAHR